MIRIDPSACEPATLLTLDEIRTLLVTAERLDEPIARAVQLACLVPCHAAAIASAPIELADPVAGLLRLRAHPDHWSTVALAAEAMMIVEAAADGRTAGPLLVDHHGEPLAIDGDAERFAIELLALDDDEASRIAWSFDVLQCSVAFGMAAIAVPAPILMRQMGRMRCDGLRGTPGDALRLQRRSAGIWMDALVEGHASRHDGPSSGRPHVPAPEQDR